MYTRPFPVKWHYHNTHSLPRVTILKFNLKDTNILAEAVERQASTNSFQGGDRDVVDNMGPMERDTETSR